ncbi:imm11 family protein [Vibrio chagasii]|nr:DUF1629 domain-containing protein [Vibrio chagasii]
MYKPLFGVGELFLRSINEVGSRNSEEMEKLRFADKNKVDESSWLPISCYISYVDSDTGEKFIESDVPSNCDGMMIFNKKGKEALSSFIKPYGQFLPLDCEGKELYILNIFNVVDCLDLDKSEIMFREELDLSDPQPVIDDYEFDVKKLGENALFRLPYKNEARIYFTESFINEIEKHQLTGFNYRAIWKS